MKNEASLYEIIPMPDNKFPTKLGLTSGLAKDNYAFYNHWHPQIELLFFVSGKGIIECNSKPIQAKAGDLIVVNSNDLHQGKAVKDNTSYYCIITDTSLLKSQSLDLCQTKYITPISQNRIIFKNKIANDPDVQKCIKNIINEFKTKQYGFELAIKSSLYQLIVLLLRNHVEQILTEVEVTKRNKNLQRFNPIFKYIEQNFNNKISVDDLAKKASLSRYHFCRIFKEITDKSPNEYINYIRINKAEDLLMNSNLNVTEVAMNTGFNNLNYFSRVFKKIKNISPSELIKN